MTQVTTSSFRQMGRQRREAHRRALWQEAERLVAVARSVGVQRVILFGSLTRGEDNALSDLDLLVVWDTPLGFLERTVELYRCLQPRVAVDLLVYTEEFVVGHSVEALSRWAAEFDVDFEQLRQDIAPLDGYYIPTRYPNGLPDSIPARVYTRPAGEEALRLADRTLRLVREKLREEKV